jgi:16S rRNA processing protein RimM
MDLSFVGYFIKTHGFKGQLIFKIDHDFEIEKAKALFVETAGSKAPFFISELKEGNNGIIIGLEDVESEAKAKSLIGKKIYAETTLLFIEEEDDNEWLGFEVIDKNFGSLGAVHEVSDNGEQLLLSLTFKDKEVILPLVDEFITQIDAQNKKLYFNAPEGLIDVYLEE